MTQRQAVNADDADGVQHQGERTWYVYDAAGQRVRKVTERPTGQRQGRAHLPRRLRDLSQATAANRARARDAAHHGRQAAHRPGGDAHAGQRSGVPQQLIRYQFGNHLGSASLELDDQAQIISYEEYYPYGSTSYQAVRSQTETPKRYRYTGKERDEETGLDYHSARYYALWLGRWLSTDPDFLVDGTALYTYARSNPIIYCDPNGTTPETDDLLKELRKLFSANINLLKGIFEKNTHIGTYAAWLTEGIVKDIFGPAAAGNVPYSKSSRVSVDVKIPGTRTANELKLSEKAIRPKQAIRQTANAKATKEILATVMPNKIKKQDYSGGLTKRQRETSSKAAQKIRDWKANAPARRKLLPAPNSQSGLARLGLMGGLAVAGLAVGVLAGSESARSVAKDMAVVGAMEYGAAKVIGTKQV